MSNYGAGLDEQVTCLIDVPTRRRLEQLALLPGFRGIGEAARRCILAGLPLVESGGTLPLPLDGSEH